jgi:hypothetical protein
MKQKSLCGLLFVIALLILSACSEPASPTSGKRDGAKSYVTTTLLTPYPGARTVRLFIADLPSDDPTDQGMSNPRGRLLSPNQRALFETAIHRQDVTGRIPEDFGVTAGCFFPHHFFRYYDRNGHAIGEIAVCFCCGGAQATPRLMTDTQRSLFTVDLQIVGRLVTDMGFSTEVNCTE